MKKRIISLLLCMALLIGIMPTGLFTLTAGALTDPPTGAGYPTVKVKNWDELKTALSRTDDVIVSVTEDITGHFEKIESSNHIDYWHICTHVIGNKILELNGNDIYFEDDRNAYDSGNTAVSGKRTLLKSSISVAFHVDKTADLTVQDSKGGGKIHSGGYFIGTGHRYPNMGINAIGSTIQGETMDYYLNYCYRNLFYVEGNMTVKSGILEAGKTKNQWITDDEFKTFAASGDTHTGYITQGVGGTAIAVFDGGSLTVFGGTISGTGAGEQYNALCNVNMQSYYQGFTTNKRVALCGGWYTASEWYHPAAAIAVCKNSSVTIYDGEYYGYNGASPILVDSEKIDNKHLGAVRPIELDLSVYGGEFSTRKHDWVRLIDKDTEWNNKKYFTNATESHDYLENMAFYESTDTQLSKRVQYTKGHYGTIEIPAYAIKGPYTRMISHGIDVTNDTIKNGSYMSDRDVTVTCGGMGTSQIIADKDVLYNSDGAFLFKQQFSGDKYYYPEESNLLMGRTKIQYRFRVTDLDDKSKKFDFTTSYNEGINLLNFVDKSKLISGHKYRISGTCVQTYKGDPLEFTAESLPTGTAEFTYSDAVFPNSSVYVSQNYTRNCASGVGTVNVVVALSNLTSATKIELTSPFSDKKYTKLAENNGAYIFTLDESALTFGTLKNYNITLTAVDTAGNTIYKNISASYYSAPWMTSSKTSKYTKKTSTEKLVKNATITLYSHVSLPSGYTVQWYSAPVTNGSIGTASKISGATSANYTATYTADIAYYFVVTETATGKTAYSNTVILNEDTDTYCATITASGEQASNTNAVTLTCNAYNYTGTLTYKWYIAEGPEGYYQSEISGISSAASRQSISFPSDKLLKNDAPPGTYEIYCEVKDSGKGITYKTPTVTVTLDRKVESVTVTDRKNGYKYLGGINIYLPSETGTVSLKTEVTPSNTNENYTVEYYGYDHDIIEVTPEGVIKGKKSGKTLLYARYYHEDGTQLCNFCWTVFVPISTVDIYLFGRPVVNEYPTYEAYTVSPHLNRNEHYWYDVDSNSYTSVQNKVVEADKKYGYWIEMSLKQPDDYYFPVNSYTLEEYYDNKGNYPIDVTRVDNYINSDALEIRWHLDENFPESYETDSDNQKLYVSGNQIISEYELGRIYDKTKKYIDYCYYYFAAPDVGMTVTKSDIVKAFYTSQQGFKIVSASNNSIYDATTKTWVDSATMELGHRYQVYLVIETLGKYNYYSGQQNTDDDSWRMADNFELYVDVEPITLSSQTSESAFFTFEFIPGGGQYIKEERICGLEYGTGKVAARLDSAKINEQGLYLNMYDEAGGTQYNSTCNVSELYWESAEGRNKFLADGTFKPETEYTLVMHIEMDEDRPEDACYNLDTIVLDLMDGKSHSLREFNRGNNLEVINNVRKAIVKLRFPATGYVNNLTIAPPVSTVKASENYTLAWTFINSKTVTVINDMESRVRDITVSYAETDTQGVTADEYFVLTAPASTTLEPGESMTFDVRLKPGLKPGTYTGYFNIVWPRTLSINATQKACVVATVTDRDWYYVSGEVRLPEEMTYDPLAVTEVRLFKENGTSTGYTAEVDPTTTGGFTIEHVPAGTYTAKATADDGTVLSKTILVEDDVYDIVFDFTGTVPATKTGISLDKESVKPGDTFKVKLKLPEPNTEIQCTTAELTLPKDYFELVSPLAFNGGNTGFNLTGNYMTDNGDGTETYVFAYYSVDNVRRTVPSDTLTAEFRVLNTAKVGNADIVLSYAGSTCNEGNINIDYFVYSTQDYQVRNAKLLILGGTQTGSTVSGSLTAFGDENAETLIILTKQGESTPSYAVSVTGNSTNYSISGVASGTYTMTVTKEGHKTFTETVTVAGTDIVKNITLEKEGSASGSAGDVNGDGSIDASDLVRLKKYLAGQGVEINKTGADCNGDGSVDASDLVRLKKYLAGQPVILGK